MNFELARLPHNFHDLWPTKETGKHAEAIMLRNFSEPIDGKFEKVETFNTQTQTHGIPVAWRERYTDDVTMVDRENERLMHIVHKLVMDKFD